MPYVITAPCIADYSCLEICPVNCIGPAPEDAAFENAEQLYIDPQTCIDCGACVQACPVLAIYKDNNVPERWAHYVKVNSDYFRESGSLRESDS